MFYILDNTNTPTPVKVTDEEYKLRRLQSKAIKNLFFTEISTKDFRYEISTVFLSIDHRFSANGEPLLFETMIFTLDPRYDAYQFRYTSYYNAEIAHNFIVKTLTKHLKKNDI